jgi:exodeoxyribonuclease VII small subunit
LKERVITMPKKEISFEKAMERLEEIVNSLESGESPLDKSLSLFEEGVKLVKLCNEKLEKAEESVKKLINVDGELIETDFEVGEAND